MHLKVPLNAVFETLEHTKIRTRLSVRRYLFEEHGKEHMHERT